MILLADSGATKTDWCLETCITGRRIIQTEGINPFHQTEEKILDIIENGLLPQLHTETKAFTHIFFYGAGCLPSKTKGITRVLELHFPNASVRAESDLLGAARALCQNRPGIACILGTGSNSCYYDGKKIVQNVSPLGYILGDEGSGAYLGKRFIGDCLKGLLPADIRDGLLEEYHLSTEEILNRTYRQPQANRFLSGITPYIYKYKDMPQIHAFLLDCFSEFFRRNIRSYPSGIPVSFTGSIAWFFRQEIEETARSLNIPTGRFVKKPIEELAIFHLKNQLEYEEF